MHLVIVGTGYVGLVSGTCLAETGHNVICIDNDKEKIDNLNNNIIPIYEPGLSDLIAKNVLNNRLSFTTDYNAMCTADAVFVCVGTPQDEDGSADLQYVYSVAREFGSRIKKHSVIIDKSTVPVGTAQKVREIVQSELDKRGSDLEFDVVSNPEFLKEGSAINDFINPDRIIIGTDSEFGQVILEGVYKNMDQSKIIFTDIPSAEMIKYAANAMLATRISFMNDIANLCDLTGANIHNVIKGIGLDTRIGTKFLNAGCGYGGSCLPKDVKALIQTGKEHNYIMNVLNAVEEVNESQKHILYRKLYSIKDMFDTPIKKIAILGLSFKPNTTDMREATSTILINDLLTDKFKICTDAEIVTYDPVALKDCEHIFGDKISYCEDIDNTIMDADVTFIVTEWEHIKKLSIPVFKKLVKHPIIIDGRNCLTVNDEDIKYIGIGVN